MERYIKIGSLIIGKGNKFIFDTLSGIETGSVDRGETKYVEMDGADISDVYFEPKTIEISGHIYATSQIEMEQLKRQLIQSCNPKIETDVFYCNGVNTYYARAMGDGLPEFGKRYNNSWTLPFVAYLIIPKFFWLSESEIQTNIFSVTPLLNSGFSFPGKFSTRVSHATVNNDGDVPVYPVIEIICNTANTTGISIQNTTTGKELAIDYTVTPLEKITVNMEEMTIISSLRGSIITSINTNSDFWSYEQGENEIQCATDNLYIVSLHRNRYMGV